MQQTVKLADFAANGQARRSINIHVITIYMILARKVTRNAYCKDDSIRFMDCLVAFSISGHHSRDCPRHLIKPHI